LEAGGIRMASVGTAIIGEISQLFLSPLPQAQD